MIINPWDFSLQSGTQKQDLFTQPRCSCKLLTQQTQNCHLVFGTSPFLNSKRDHRPLVKLWHLYLNMMITHNWTYWKSHRCLAYSLCVWMCSVIKNVHLFLLYLKYFSFLTTLHINIQFPVCIRKQNVRHKETFSLVHRYIWVFNYYASITLKGMRQQLCFLKTSNAD